MPIENMTLKKLSYSLVLMKTYEKRMSNCYKLQVLVIVIQLKLSAFRNQYIFIYEWSTASGCCQYIFSKHNLPAINLSNEGLSTNLHPISRSLQQCYSLSDGVLIISTSRNHTQTKKKLPNNQSTPPFILFNVSEVWKWMCNVQAMTRSADTPFPLNSSKCSWEKGKQQQTHYTT